MSDSEHCGKKMFHAYKGERWRNKSVIIKKHIEDEVQQMCQEFC